MSIYSHLGANAHGSGRGRGTQVAIATSTGEVAGTIGGQAVSTPQDRTSTPEDLRLALRAATLYYLDGLTQAEIASRLGVSRPTAGRLVARAKAKGLVRIDVVVPSDMRDDLHADEERELEQRYSLTEAVVAGHGIDVGATGRPAAYASVGRAAAALLMRRLSPNDVLGFTWGPEQVAVADALSPGVASCRAVVQLDGAMSTAAYQTGTELILGRCAMLRATTIRLPAPCMQTRRPWLDAQRLADLRTLETGRRADVMLFGVGARVDVDHAVRRQLRGHPNARRAHLSRCGGRDRRPVLRRRRHARRLRAAAACGLRSSRRRAGLYEDHPDFQRRHQTPRHSRRVARQARQAAGLRHRLCPLVVGSVRRQVK